MDIQTSSAADGVKAVRFNSGQRTPNGVLSQSFATTAGQSYTLTFNYGVYSPVRQREQRLSVTVRACRAAFAGCVPVCIKQQSAVDIPFLFIRGRQFGDDVDIPRCVPHKRLDRFLPDNVRVTAGDAPTPPAEMPPSAFSGLTNGSFEQDYTGWTATGNMDIQTSSAADGVKAVRFNSGQRTPNGVLSQSFATTAGQSYTLTLIMVCTHR